MNPKESGPQPAATGAAQNTDACEERSLFSPAPQRRLVDILAGNTDEIRKRWDSTEAAAEFAPLPTGTYECHVQAVELFNAQTGTPGVKIRFRVCDGEHAGRMLFHNSWLTPAALPQTKRDCQKLGLDSLAKLETAAVPAGRIRCKVRVALRRDDDGCECNRVRRFDVLGIDEPEADPFAPTVDAADDADTGDTSFDFGKNVEAKVTDAPQTEGGAS